MKKYCLLLTFILSISVSCQKSDFDDELRYQQAEFILGPTIPVPPLYPVEDDMVLGSRLANPYSVINMRQAYDSMVTELIDAGIQRDDIRTTHFYVKFKPESEEELRSIKDSYSEFDIYEYPLDYEISGRVSYHDPFC